MNNVRSLKDDIKESLIKKRISEKIKDYENYSFTVQQDCALKTFFDLAQEFEGQEDFFTICVLIPKVFFQLNCNLYLTNNDGNFELEYRSKNSSLISSKNIIHPLDLNESQPTDRDSFYIPIRGNMQLLSSLHHSHHNGILGIFEIEAASKLSDPIKFFFEKYVNRIGFQLTNRSIAEKNKEHLQFIQNLVNDIGHNVIVPNMYFKLFFRRMKGKIDRANTISKEMIKQTELTRYSNDETLFKDFLSLANEMKYLNDSMEDQFQEIVTHYEQTSLFLETLLRRSHFEEGRYVIEPRMVNFREKIIRPQLNRYISRFQERGISVDNQLSEIPDEEITAVADVGLISQAFANLFSNAVKYTREVKDDKGCSYKFVSVGMEFLGGYFVEGRDGIKFNVFSTGPHLTSTDISKIFNEGYRGENIGSEYGTGHGLQFIKDVIALHNGEEGYESKDLGNNFYFILPK